MADSTTPIPQLLPAESSPEARLNELFDAASASMVYGRNAATCTERVFGYLGGRWGGFSVANGVSASLTASTTQYMVVERATGAVSFSSTTTNWDDATLYARAYKLTVGTSTITAYEDHRAGASGAVGGGSTSGGFSWKQAVRAATTTAGTLATSFENGDTIDGVTLVTGDHILIKNQSSGSENGIYVVAASGAPTRATDADSGSELVNATVFVSEGSTLADTQWKCTTNAPITVGSTSLVFAQIGAVAAPVQSIIIACSDETTALTTGAAKVTFRMPYAFTLTAVRASVTTAPTGGTLLTVDINEGGTTILSTNLTFDASEKTTTTAATPAVISDSSLADDAEMSIDIDAVGSTIAGAGLKVYLIGTKT